MNNKRHELMNREEARKLAFIENMMKLTPERVHLAVVQFEGAVDRQAYSCAARSSPTNSLGTTMNVLSFRKERENPGMQ